LFLRNRTADSPNGYQWGGAVEIGGPVNGELDPTSAGSIINSVFVDNYAAERGGAIYNNGNTDVINCTFFGNSAGIDGQTLHNYSNINFRVSNCIVWGSSGAGSVIGASNYNFSGTYTMVRNSIIQGGHSGTGTVNVLTSDPLFQDAANPLGADGRFGTTDDGLGLALSSPAIGAGSNAYVPGGVTTDVLGATRVVGTVDLGAYEIVQYAPTVTDQSVANVSATGATLGGNVTYDGRATITERGVVYSATATNSNPLIGGNGVVKVATTGTTGVFTLSVAGLTTGSGYSYKAYATNGLGTSYTSVATFTTATNAEFSLLRLSSLSLSSGTLSPVFTSDTISYTASVATTSSAITVTPTLVQGNATIQVRINGGTFSNVISGTATASLALNVGNNIVDVQVRSQVGFINSYQIVVLRQGPGPTVLNPAVNAISASSAQLGANITNDNGSIVVERGVVYAPTSVNRFPVIGGAGVTKIITTGAIGEFIIPALGLSQGTMYSFSGYAINSNGINYTHSVTFSTTSTNADLASLSLRSATMNFNFTPASNTKIAYVGSGTDGISVVASPEHPRGALQVRINGGALNTLPAGTPSQFLPLNVGTNSIEVHVTAQDGLTQKLYQIAVVRSSNPMVSLPEAQTNKVGQRLEGNAALKLLVEGGFTSIEATGLPPGLRLDKSNWTIAGRPTAARFNSKRQIQPYTVKVRARGISGFGPWVSFPWTVEPIPPGLSGGFEGFAGYDSEMFPVAVQVRVSASGVVTGYLRMEAPTARVAFSAGRERRVSIKGLVITSQDGSSGVVEASGRLGSETWLLSLNLPTGGGATIGWLEEPSGDRLDVSAWRLNTVPQPTQTGVFHVRLRPYDEAFHEGSDVKVPEGDGFARVTIGKTGLGRVSGRLPDGTALNVSAGLGDGGELGLFAMINQRDGMGWTVATGGISGQLRINNAVVEGEGIFTRLNRILGKTNRIHPEGFSLSVAAEGGRFSLNAGGMVLGLNLPLQPDNTQVIMTGGALPGISMLTQNVSIGLRNRVSLARGGSFDNANYVSFSLNAQTGLWSGTFSYDGTSARSRRGVFQGLLIPRLNGGFGYQLLGEPAEPTVTPPTTDANSPQRSGAVYLAKTIPEFRFVPGGVFTMGRTSGDTDADAPPVWVNLSAFYMQRTETTKAEWDEVRAWGVPNGYTDLSVGGGKAANHPVQSVSWWDVVKWCNARSEKEGLTPVYAVSGEVMRTGTTVPTANWSANGYRLPTEAEWEKAARGGVEGKRFPWGTDTISHATANYLGNSSLFSYDLSSYLSGTFHPSYNDGFLPITSPVGSFAANGYGLHDLSGNVQEWCWDWFAASYYMSGTTDPRGSPSGSSRVLRDGSWGGAANQARCSFRSSDVPGSQKNSTGFRPVLHGP
jgi:formylglycine-generating enzyme required for sulfatase activity